VKAVGGGAGRGGCRQEFGKAGRGLDFDTGTVSVEVQEAKPTMSEPELVGRPSYGNEVITHLTERVEGHSIRLGRTR
jgi:hypothetical protein